MASRGLGLLSRKDAGVRLVDHLHALGEAVELCDGRVDSDALDEARRVVDQADRGLAIPEVPLWWRSPGLPDQASRASSTPCPAPLWQRSAYAAQPPHMPWPAAGARNRPRNCWTGSKSRAGMRWRRIRRRPRRSMVWCCWTFLIMTPPKLIIEWRSIGWCGWWTCWSGWSIRKSMPTPQSMIVT